MSRKHKCVCPQSCILHPPGTSGGPPRQLPKPKRYPEHVKLERVQPDSQVIGEFLEWLQGSGKMVLAEYNYFSHGTNGKRWRRAVPMLLPTSASIEKILAKYFRISPEKIEREKREMLADIRRTG